MKRFIRTVAPLFVVALTLFGSSPVQSLAANASDWFGDYHEAKAVSVAAGQRLLVVLENPSEPQHTVEQISTMTSAVEADLLKPFTACRIDVSTEKGKEMAAKFGVTEFPYTAVIDKTGKWIVYSNAGRYSNSEWLTLLVTYAKETLPARNASNDANCFT